MTGGTPRYRLYRTRDGGHAAVAAIEQRFWDNFCDAIGLEPALRRDRDDPETTIHRVGEIIGAERADPWRERFAGRDCCCTIVTGLEAASRDPHFLARGVFRHALVNDQGDTLPALPVPIDPVFRGKPEHPVAAPGLGADDDDYLSPRESPGSE